MRGVVAAALALVAGCTDFDTIDRDVCGNGLLEPGEDCDSDDASCVRCAVVCSAASDCPNESYACGVDGVCHAPGGALGQPVASGTFQVNEYRVTDIDHDRIGDVLGLSRTSIVVRHGAASAGLGKTDSIVTPSQTGPASFGDLDEDGALDVTLTTFDGIVSYSSSYGELAPVAIHQPLSDETGNPLDVRKLFHLAPTVFGAFIVDSGVVYLFTIDFSNPFAAQPSVMPAAPCGARIGPVSEATFEPTAVDVFQVNRDTNSKLDSIVSFVSGPASARKLCVMSIHREAYAGIGATPAIEITDITPAGAASPQTAPMLADLDLDTDVCPGLLDRDGGATGMKYWDGAMVNSRCSFTASVSGTPLPPITDAAPGVKIVARLPLEPAMFGVATDALVLSDGVYVYLPNGTIFEPNRRYSPVYRSTRPLALAEHGDLNGDGYIDAVVAAEGEDDLDLLLRATTASGYQLLRLDTASEATTLTIDDFDGNGINDIAFTERQDDHQRMMISYGTPDRPLDPVSVGVFTDVREVVRIQFTDSIDQLGVAADLLVLQPVPNSNQTRISFLHGSPQRTMLTYFDPRNDTSKGETLFRGSVIGNFSAAGMSGGLADVLAIAPLLSNATSGPSVKAWLVPGTPDGLDGTQNGGVGINGVADCTRGTGDGLCLDQALYQPFPIDDDHDVVIAIDHGLTALLVDPWTTSTPVTPTQLPALTSKIPSDVAPRALYPTDLDGDGVRELVAAFSPTSADSSGSLLVCSTSAGSAATCNDLVPAIVAASGGSVRQCFDAAPAKISTRGPTSSDPLGFDLVAACRGTEGTGLYRVHRDATGADIVDRLALSGAPIVQVRAGDVTGDGIDDLVLVEGEPGAQSLLVYPQCGSRDVGCITSAVSASEESP